MTNLDRVRKLYKQVAARLVIDRIASLPNALEMKVDSIEAGLGVPRPDVIDILRKLADYGCGEFIVGRRKKPSRMRWAVDPRGLRAAAAGEAEEIGLVAVAAEEAAVDEPQEEEETADDDDDSITHSFRLRPDLIVDFALPADLTRSEAERLAKFIQSLPFE